MLRNVRLKLLPNPAFCLRWSVDGTLAILAGEDVILLIPKIQLDSPPIASTRASQFWHSHARTRELIVANMDTEIPLADADIYSIGEEQGPGYVKDVSWSPLGAGKHRRCLIALLTANHEAYVFAPHGEMEADWRMVVNLSGLVEEHEWPIEEGEEKVKEEVGKQLRKRARAIAWSGPAKCRGNRWGESLLAVANDVGGILLIRVRHESAEVVASVRPFSFEEAVVKNLGKRVTHFENLAWSPWIKPGVGRWRALLAYSFMGQVWVSKVDLDESTLKVTVENVSVSVGKAPTDRHPVGGIAWAPQEVGGDFLLAYAVQRHVHVVLLSSDGGRVLGKESFTNDFTEMITGFSLAPAKSADRVFIQLVTAKGRTHIVEYVHPSGKSESKHRTHDHATEDAMSTPHGATDQDLRILAGYWSTAIFQSKQDFIDESDLTGAVVRVYGLATSPLGGVTAVAASYHPDDMVEYITGANERMVVMFGTHEGESGLWEDVKFDADEKHVPSPFELDSSALFIELSSQDKAFTNRVREAVDALAAESLIDKEVVIDGEDLKASVMTATLGPPELNARRYRAVLSHRSKPKESLREDPEIVASAVLAVLAAPYDKSPTSMRLIYSMACVGILGLYKYPQVLHLARKAFDWLSGNTPDNVSFDLEMRIIEMYTSGGPQLDVERGVVSGMEKCTLCGEGVVWRDLRIAECTRGHRFSRCAMTYLPIVKTRRTKECILCRRVVLNREALDEQGKGGVLIKALMEAWEVCLQCGGRFWTEEV